MPRRFRSSCGGRELWLSISGVGFADGTVYAFRDLTQDRVLEELKADFVSTVSHELRTPLAADLRRGDDAQRAVTSRLTRSSATSCSA